MTLNLHDKMKLHLMKYANQFVTKESEECKKLGKEIDPKEIYTKARRTMVRFCEQALARECAQIELDRRLKENEKI